MVILLLAGFAAGCSAEKTQKETKMKAVNLTPEYFSGVWEYEEENNAPSPRRMPADLYPKEDGYMKSCSAGIRILLETDSPCLKLDQTFFRRDSKDFTGTTTLVVDHGKPQIFNAPEPEHEKGGDSFSFTAELPADGMMHRVEIWLSHQRRTIISGLYVAENANVQPAPQEDEIILFLGDSITQGFFGQGTDTWANLFALGRKSGIVNLGVGGGKMPFGDQTMIVSNAVDRDLTVLAYGVNDCAGGRDPDQFREATRETLEILAAKGPVLLLTPISSTLYEKQKNLTERLNLFRQILREEGERFKNVRVIDGPSLLPCDDRYFPDGLHPNPEGMRIIAAELLKQTTDFPASVTVR